MIVHINNLVVLLYIGIYL